MKTLTRRGCFAPDLQAELTRQDTFLVIRYLGADRLATLFAVKELERVERCAGT